MAGWDTAVAEEVAYLQHLPVACVVSDIVIGILVGEKLGVRNIGIANFTGASSTSSSAFPTPSSPVSGKSTPNSTS